MDSEVFKLTADHSFHPHLEVSTDDEESEFQAFMNSRAKDFSNNSERLGKPSSLTASQPVLVKSHSPAIDSHGHHAPLKAIRQALHELETGELDERLVFLHLLHLDPKSTEFRQEYARLRVANYRGATESRTGEIRPLESFDGVPLSLAHERNAYGKTPSGDGQPKTPWQINCLLDLFSFYGPWLTIIVAIQCYTAFLASRIIASLPSFELGLHRDLIAALIAVLFLLLDGLILWFHRGKDFHNFAPLMLILSGVSGVTAIIGHIIKMQL